MPSATDKNQFLTDTDVLIVGSGFSGLCMARFLKRHCANITFAILERADGVGGAWRDNVYPGAACDIPSHLYSYSFRPKHDWSRVYAPQREILEYLQQTAEDEGVVPHIIFGAELLSATWDADARRWVVTSGAGTHRCRTLVTASGHLSDPSFPDIPRFASFAGRTFHSARWDPSADLSGARIGVIGTGASAIQIVPQLAPSAEHLTVFQRSAPYVIPRMDREFSVGEKRLFERLPSVAQSLRDELFWSNESRFPQRRQVPLFVDQIRERALWHLEDQVAPGALREKLTPGYEIGCKRILIANDFYPALQLPNVDLIVEPITKIVPEGVMTRDGKVIPLDVLVAATGFEATELPIARRIKGRDGVLLAESWQTGGNAYHCTTVAGFPNLFVMLGPNTGLGAGSMIYMIETQAAYIQEAIAYILAEDATVEPTPEAQTEYVDSIDERAGSTVWINGGCESWYLHPDSGRLTTLWPDFMSQFRSENGSFSPRGYHIDSARRELMEAVPHG